MKSSLVLFAVVALVLLSGNSIFGQERNVELERRQAAHLQIIQELESASSSGVARELYTQVKLGNETAILDAGKTGDKSLLPLLEVLAKQGSANAEVALVRLGENEYLTRMLSQTSKGEDIKVRYSAVRKLTLIDNKAAYQRLYELLDDTIIPKSALDDVSLASMSSIVMFELSKKINDSPCKGKLSENVVCWKNWFEKNRLQK